MSEHVIELTQVTKSFSRGGSHIQPLREVSFALPRGSFVALCGPSGSGKSTLLNIIGGVEVPDSGTVDVCGKRIDYRSEEGLRRYRQERVGYLFQHFQLLSHLTATENVMVPLLLSKVAWNTAIERSAKALTDLGLADRADHYPQELSGGEMQRVALARATVHRPALIIADEPTGSLDRESGNAVIELLARCAQGGTTVLMATHNEHILGACSDVLRLVEGQVTFERASFG